MKKVITLILLLNVFFTFGQVPSGCGSTNWPSNVTTLEGSVFTVPAGLGAGWTYVWVVTPGLEILSGQGTTTVLIKGLDGFWSGSVYVTRYKNGVSACADVKTIAIGCNYTLFILDEYIDGTQSGSNSVHLSVGGNYPIGTTYEWTLTRQDGSVQYYPPQATRVRVVSASIDNRITEATVVANFSRCYSEVTKTFRCAIPNSDIYGNLFPECEGIRFDKLSNQKTEIKVSPNPTSSLLQFEGSNLKNYKISIFNINGNEIVKDSKIDQNINIEKNDRGIYFYIITDEKGFKQKGKIIKE